MEMVYHIQSLRMADFFFYRKKLLEIIVRILNGVEVGIYGVFKYWIFAFVF